MHRAEITLCQQHLGPPQKKRDREGSLSTCDQQFMMGSQEHNRSWKGNCVSVWRRCVGCCVMKKKTRCHACVGSNKQKSVIAKKLPRRGFFSITVLITSKNIPETLYEYYGLSLIRKTYFLRNQDICNYFGRNSSFPRSLANCGRKRHRTMLDQNRSA